MDQGYVRGAALLVLVAEDDSAERELIAFRRECAGFAVSTCATGSDVLGAVDPSVSAVVSVGDQLPLRPSAG